MEHKSLFLSSVLLFCFIILIGCSLTSPGGDPTIIFNAASLEIDVDEQVNINEHIKTSETIKDISCSSSDPGIAAIDNNGILSGVSPGNARITLSVTLDTNPEFQQTLHSNVSVRPNNLVENVAKVVNDSKAPTKRYYIDAATDCKYNITWEGDIDVALFEKDNITPIVPDEFHPGSLNIHTDECKTVNVHVALEKGGSFQLKYAIDRTHTPKTWTLLVYMCNTFMDPENLDDLVEMINGFHPNIHINLVVLLDRESANEHDLFNELFYDTRLFVMQHEGAKGYLQRINGAPQFPGITAVSDNYEANMGDPETLARFIEYGKKNYPAQYYGVIFASHGFGVGGFSEDKTNNNDVLHLGEINDPDNPVLTRDHFVNMLIFDCCHMGGIETAYQFRKSADNPGFYADYMLAAPTELHITSFRYDKIFERISLAGGSIAGDKEDITGGTEDEKIYDPRTMDPIELGRIIIEEETDSVFTINEIWAKNEVLSLYNLAYAGQVKAAIDELAVSLYENEAKREEYKTKWEALRDDDTKVNPHYSKSNILADWEYEVLEFPIYELYDLCSGIVNGDISADSKAKANQTINLFSDMLVYSYYGEATDNTKGISIFFPHGDYVFKTGRFTGQKMFQHQWWYNALYTGDISPTNLLTQQYYGKLSWCANGATPGDGGVSNYFELLDYWYDKGDAGQGGWNRYKY